MSAGLGQARVQASRLPGSAPGTPRNSDSREKLIIAHGWALAPRRPACRVLRAAGASGIALALASTGALPGEPCRPARRARAMMTRRCFQSMPCASSSARMAATVELRCRLTNGRPASASRSTLAAPASAWSPATISTTSSSRYGAACRAGCGAFTHRICIYPAVSPHAQGVTEHKYAVRRAQHAPGACRSRCLPGPSDPVAGTTGDRTDPAPSSRAPSPSGRRRADAWLPPAGACWRRGAGVRDSTRSRRRTCSRCSRSGGMTPPTSARSASPRATAPQQRRVFSTCRCTATSGCRRLKCSARAGRAPTSEGGRSGEANVHSLLLESPESRPLYTVHVLISNFTLSLKMSLPLDGHKCKDE